jgi:hypothetical protein
MGKTSAADVTDKAAGLAVYLLQHGGVVGDGETGGGIGRGAEMRVRHAMSGRVPGLPVLHATPLVA